MIARPASHRAPAQDKASRIMDMNQLLNAHQRALMENGGTRAEAVDITQASRVAAYADRIERLRDHYASKIGGDFETWESEGGSMADSQSALPPGITMTWRPEFRVGPYVYSDLSLALAELERQQGIVMSRNLRAPEPRGGEHGSRRNRT